MAEIAASIFGTLHWKYHLLQQYAQILQLKHTDLLQLQILKNKCIGWPYSIVSCNLLNQWSVNEQYTINTILYSPLNVHNALQWTLNLAVKLGQ